MQKIRGISGSIKQPTVRASEPGVASVNLNEN